MLIRPPGRAARAASLIAACILPLGGCAGGRQAPAGDVVASDPASLIDGYLIARGMALSYGRSGRASAGEIAQLIHYDRAALAAVATAQLEPGGARNRQAEHALEALVDYTGRNDLRADPPQAPTAPAVP